MPVDTNPEQTVGTSMSQPRCSMDLKDSVDLVSGRKQLIHWRMKCMPSTGQMIPQRRTMGRKDPRARQVAVRSVSQRQDTTKPDGKYGLSVTFVFGAGNDCQLKYLYDGFLFVAIDSCDYYFLGLQGLLHNVYLMGIVATYGIKDG